MSNDLPGPRRCVIAAAGVRISVCALAAMAVVLVITTGFAHAQSGALTEHAAIDMALARSAYRAAEEGRIAVAQSAVTQAGLPPNPNVTLLHEQGRATGGRASETALQVSPALDISGRRRLRREAAEQRLDAAQFDRASARSRVIVDVRNAFADALYRDRVRSGLRAWNQRIDAVYTAVSQLKKAGEASGYERRRLERERQAAQARMPGRA